MAGNSGYVDFIATNYSSQQTLRVHWQETVNDDPGAKSTVAITSVWLASASYVGDTYYGDFILQINGTDAVTVSGNASTYLGDFNEFYEVKRGSASLTGSVGNISHDAQGNASVNITLKKRGIDYAGFYRMGAHFSFTTTSVSKSINLYQIPVGVLSISQATGSTITVARSGSVLTAGTKLWYGQQLVITFAASYGWRLDSHTVNGDPFTSGGTHPVTGNVAVATSASRSASTISTPNGTFGASQTLTITRYISGATHTISYAVAGQTRNITGTPSWDGNTGTLAWTPDPNLMSYIPNATSASCVISITTYSGSLEIGTTTTTITLSLPTSGTYNVTPTPSITDSDSNGYASAMGGYVAGKSVLSVAISDGLKYGATLASRSTTANGVTSQAASFSAGLLSGNTSITTQVRDSRGLTATAQKSIAVQAYDSPVIATFAARRTDDQGNHSPVGAYMTISWSAAITSLGGHNTMTLGLKYKKVADSTWTVVDMTQASASGTTAAIPADIASSYDIQFSVTDYFETVMRSMKLSTAAVVESRRPQGKGVAFSKVAETDNAFDIGSWSAIGRVKGLGRARSDIPAQTSGEYTNFNDFVEPGVYGVWDSTAVATYRNCPSSVAGILTVTNTHGDDREPTARYYTVSQTYEDINGQFFYRYGIVLADFPNVTWQPWQGFGTQSALGLGSLQTYTPTVSWSDSSTITVSSIFGYYVQVGNVLWVSMRCRITNLGTTGDKYLLISLPSGYTTPSTAIYSTVGTVVPPTGNSNQYLVRPNGANSAYLAVHSGGGADYPRSSMTTGYYSVTAFVPIA